MEYKIAVCDDSEADTGYLSRLLREWAESEQIRIQEEIFPSAEAFLFRYAEKKDFDILLLDIEMGGMDGVELAEKLRKSDQEITIVFITGYPDYIAKGYDVSALHYLVKPIQKDKLFEVLNRAVAMKGKKRKTVCLSMGRETILIYPDEIIYAEAQGHYIILHTRNGEEKIRMTLQEMAELLGEGFFQCGRSFIVGLKWVGRITKKTVVLSDQRELPLGKGLYDEINQALVRYLRAIV